MSELRTGETISLQGGGKVTIKKELGRGGQGIVYQVDYNGKDEALKWYLKDEGDLFYRNLQRNVNSTPPSSNFLWPLRITERQNESFGYVMHLRPKGYYELGDFFTAKVRFKNYDCVLHAAINICNGFLRLHLSGYSYQDLNEGNFFINPENGDLLICDNDNVAANRTESGIKGKSRYMAAEVVNGGVPNIQSDVFSLAIVLYRLFMLDHPFEGMTTLKYVCLTDEVERNIYGEGAIFAWDREDNSNRPHPQIHYNAHLRWGWCPQSLQEAFQKALGKESVLHPESRMTDREWKNLFVELRRKLIVCPESKGTDHDFMVDDINSTLTCPLCGKPVEIGALLKFGDGTEYVLTRHKKLYLDDSDESVGVACVRKVDGRTELGLQNLSDNNWMVFTASGRLNELAKDDIMPLRDGMKIRFNNRTTAEVIIH